MSLFNYFFYNSETNKNKKYNKIVRILLSTKKLSFEIGPEQYKLFEKEVLNLKNQYIKNNLEITSLISKKKDFSEEEIYKEFTRLKEILEKDIITSIEFSVFQLAVEGMGISQFKGQEPEYHDIVVSVGESDKHFKVSFLYHLNKRLLHMLYKNLHKTYSKTIEKIIEEKDCSYFVSNLNEASGMSQEIKEEKMIFLEEKEDASEKEINDMFDYLRSEICRELIENTTLSSEIIEVGNKFSINEFLIEHPELIDDGSNTLLSFNQKEIDGIFKENKRSLFELYIEFDRVPHAWMIEPKHYEK